MSTRTVDPKAHTTIYIYRHILNDYLITRWGNRTALGTSHLKQKNGFRPCAVKRVWRTPCLIKRARVMSIVYKHAQRHGLIRRSEESNPLRFVRCKTTSDYEAIILTPEQVCTVLLGLQWPDMDFAQQCMYVRRTWVHGHLGSRKTKASKAPVPLHALLAESMKKWQEGHPTLGPATGCSPAPGRRVRNHAGRTCWWRTISGRQQSRPECWRWMIPIGLVFTTCVKVWLRSSCVQRPTRRQFKRCFLTRT